MPNGIDLILADHELVNALFAEFAQAPSGIPVGQIVDALTVHDQAEHAALYPFAAELLGSDDLLTRAEVAHAAVKRQIGLLSELEGPALVVAVTELQQLVEAHVADEETNLLPALNEAATPEQLDVLGGRILQAKQRVG